MKAHTHKTKFSYFYFPDWDKCFFEVNACGILEADEKLKAETGIIAAKNSNVGCKLTKIKL